MRLKWFTILAGMLLSMPAHAERGDMLVIAHRGASGERPEHTLAAYERAIDQGADFIEPDLVVTRDGVLVARHENEISDTTDVAARQEFAKRKTTKRIDGREITGWFVEDFTLAELRVLRARERLPQVRPGNARFDGVYPIPTLAEIIALLRAKEAETSRRIGLYPELKHPTFLSGLGFDTPSLLLKALERAGYTAKDDPVMIQSFEITPLVDLRSRTKLRLVQLVASQGGPADRPDLTYAAMIAPEGLSRIVAYADVIGADIRLVVGEDGKATPLVENAHKAGLAVHAWTLRKENAFLPPSLRIGPDLASRGCFEGFLAQLENAGVDGVFTDDPGLTVKAIAVGAASLCDLPR